jgi:hypothetical protein
MHFVSFQICAKTIQVFAVASNSIEGCFSFDANLHTDALSMETLRNPNKPSGMRVAIQG